MSGDWHDDAACTGRNPDLFFEPTYRTIALAICATCPVTEPCLQEELDRMRDGVRTAGIFGGTTPAQRWERLGMRVVPIRHGTPGGYRTHRDRGEPACKPCFDAQARRARDRRQDRRLKAVGE